MGFVKEHPDMDLPVLNLRRKVVTAAVTLKRTPTSFVRLSNATTAIAVTIDAPKEGWFLVVTQADAGTAGHTVTLTAGTFDGTNNVATFNAAGETLVLMGVSSTRFVVVENIGSVSLGT